MHESVRSLLDRTAMSLCEALAQLLPTLDGAWWEKCVVAKLSFQQRQQLEVRRISQLTQLDLAALLRVLDQNWFELANARKWPYEVRNFVKEMQTVRNRWAHANVAAPSPDDAYRDLDTIQRFVTAVCSAADLAADAMVAKQAVLGRVGVTLVRRETMERNTRFVLGDIVALKAEPAHTGAVVGIQQGGTEAIYQVFRDGRTQPFYETQLVPFEKPSESSMPISAEAFHVRLTALQLLHPSTANLYSLQAARIETIPYQFRPVLKLIRSDRPRLLIADSVGVGKTIEAGLILRELQARRDVRRVLVICPRPLVTEQKWRREMKRFDERFEHLDGERLRYCIAETHMDGVWPEKYDKVILPFSLLTEELLHGEGRQKGLLHLDPPPQFDLVIVDEAHHVRNTDTQRHQAVRFFCDNSEAVVFLTATPIQLGERDLFVLLNMLRPDIVIDQPSYEALTEPNGAINEAARLARSGGPDWAIAARASLEEAAATSWGHSVLSSDPRFQRVLDSLVDTEPDRATRIDALRDIERLHTLSGIMSRTLRRDIGDFTIRKPETVELAFTPEQRRVHDAILSAQAAIYAAVHGERSVNFLLTTIRRQAASCINGLAPLLRDILDSRLGDVDWHELQHGVEEPEGLPCLSEQVSTLVRNAIIVAEQLDPSPDNDPKFLGLWSILSEKRKLPNHRAMVFSCFRHTLAYLFNGLTRRGCRVGLVHGGVPDEERVTLRRRFELEHDAPEAIDVLLFSEVGCEGLDYQFCDCIVNYDLPWNPMRVDQRIGRIDRWGQQSEAVAIYNLVTPGTVDADIYERCLLRIGVFERALGANDAILGQITQEITCVAENLSLSAAERQEKLEQLADNGIRLVREQEDLEKRQPELFGLSLPRDQFAQDVADATSYWLSPESLERLVSRYLQSRAEKADTALVGDGPRKLLKASRVLRDSLLADFRTLESKSSAIAREWETWLKGTDPHLHVTFDSGVASKERTVCLLSPVHPLIQQAAAAMAGEEQDMPVTMLEATCATVPPGDYPFAIYQWQYRGIRKDVEFRPVTEEGEILGSFFELLQGCREIDPGSVSVGAGTKAQLENIHYRLWSDARAQHLEDTAQVAQVRRSSLETSHKARMTLLDVQVAQAQNERIRTMKVAQRSNAAADHVRRLREIDDDSAKADLVARPVGWGFVRVRR